MKFSLNITWMYPDLMNTYGDRGNIIAFSKRCSWRGIEARVLLHDLDSKPSDLTQSDFIFMGGAQDRQQQLVAKDLNNNKGEILKKLIEKNIPGLFICGAYQFLGHFYKPAVGEKIPGLSIFDLYTRHFGNEKPRAIGNLVVNWHGVKLVGFENHGGRTYLGKQVKPFAEVIKGYGNNGEDSSEGAIYKNAIGSYMHGPILPKNPLFTDWLIKKALKVKYQKGIPLSNLEDSLENKAHSAMLRRFYL